VAVALGGDCLADAAVPRAEPALLRLRLAARWPWAAHINAAIQRLRALAPG